MCKRAQYNTGVVNISAADRKEICEELNITNNAITNNFKKRRDLSLITGDKGRFTINPQIFWKGEMKVRNQLLKEEAVQISFKIGQK